MISKLFSYVFNGRSAPVRISVWISDDGLTLISCPGYMGSMVVRLGQPVEIEVSGNGPGPDVSILIEAYQT